MGHTLTQAGFCGLLFWIAQKDFKTRRIEDGSLLALFLLGVLSLLSGGGPALPERLLGMAAVSVPFLGLALFLPGALGGGDVKLMAAGGFFLGSRGIWTALLFALPGSAVFCLWLLIRKKGRKAAFPLGPFLCAGMALACLLGQP